MKLGQLRAFQEVMSSGSVSAAARNLHRSQPAVSAAIASLERELGTALFERRGGRLHPVPEARYLHAECAEILGRLHAVRESLARMQAGRQGELRIVSMPGPAVAVLPELVARFAAERPDVRCTLLSRSSEAVARLVATQRFDLGIADARDAADDGRSAYGGADGIASGAADDGWNEARDGDPRDTDALLDGETFAFDCLCALPADSAQARLERVGAADLDGLALATLSAEHATSRALAARFAEADRAFRPRFVAQYFVPLLSYVEAGLAAALVDPLAVASHRPRAGAGRIVFRPFAPRVAQRLVVLTPAHRPASATARAFAALLRAELVRLRDEGPLPRRGRSDGASSAGLA